MSLRPRYSADEGDSLGTLFSRLIEDGRRVARAEIDYYKKMAVHRASGAAVGIGMALGAVFLLQSALTALLIGIGVALARWLGPAGGIIAIAVVALLVSGIIAWMAVKRITAAASGADEAEAARKEGVR